MNEVSKLERCPICGAKLDVYGPDEWKPTFYDPDSGGNPYNATCKCGFSFCNGSYDWDVFVKALNRHAVPPNTGTVEMFFGRGELGVDTVAENEDAPLREILIRRLQEPVLPIGSNLSDKGQLVDELENVLVRMHFENAESARVLERAVNIVLDSFSVPKNVPPNEPLTLTGWISVGDRLPETSGEYQCYCNGKIRIAKFKADKSGLCYWDVISNECYSALWRVTHWMPLPEPPAEAALEKEAEHG